MLVGSHAVGPREVTVVEPRAFAFIHHRKSRAVGRVQEAAHWLWRGLGVPPRRLVASRAVRVEVAQVAHHTEQMVTVRRNLLRCEHVQEYAEALAVKVGERRRRICGRANRATPLWAGGHLSSRPRSARRICGSGPSSSCGWGLSLRLGQVAHDTAQAVVAGVMHRRNHTDPGRP